MTVEQLVRAIDDTGAGIPGRPLAIYVHIPFCASKCHFCDWVTDVPVSRLRGDAEARAPYVAALCREIRFWGPVLTGSGYRPSVVYWGGGTPTRLDTGEMAAIAEALHDSFDLAGLHQWSMETTPNDLTAAKVTTMRGFGVDRVSIGAQSFDPAQLRRSGRVHGAEDIATAVRVLRSGGIENVNLDLITGFPGEALETLERSLELAIALGPPHLSMYSYRATPGTVMAMQMSRSVLASATVDRMVAAYELAMRRLSAAGYHEYCHSYWVRESGHEDLDGRFKYELLGDKIGFGSGAESTIGHHLLRNETRHHRGYLDDPVPFSFTHRFCADAPEHLVAPVGGALMTRDGVVHERFARLTGLSFPEVRSQPYLRRWLQMLREFGGRFVETTTALRMDPATVHRAYIRHVAATTGAGLQVLRA